MRPAIATIPLLLILAPPARPMPQGLVPACSLAVEDTANPGNCVLVSSVPTAGALLPLGPELFVSPTGQVGIGTMEPQYGLDVFGGLRAVAGAAIGNDAAIGLDGGWNRVIDLSHQISDFSAGANWSPVRSLVTIDPLIHLTGNDATYILSQDFEAHTQPGSDKDITYLQGPYMYAWNRGTGTMDVLLGSLSGAQTDHGHAVDQSAIYGVSIGRHDATADWNGAFSCLSGHEGTSGSIANDYGMYVFTPYTNSPLTNHYGLFLEDQDAGEQDSFAIYSEGGTSYHAGDLGIGTDTPSAKLDVAGDLVASGTKSFVQPHPDDPSKEIWFVCLEGNEAGTYFRGTAELEGGRAVIPVPEEFRSVTEAEGLTVQVTPKGHAVLWVESESLERIVVRGEADVAFSYFVNGVRRGYADFEPIRERPERASNASQRDRGARRAALLERERLRLESRE